MTLFFLLPCCFSSLFFPLPFSSSSPPPTFSSPSSSLLQVTLQIFSHRPNFSFTHSFTKHNFWLLLGWSGNLQLKGEKKDLFADFWKRMVLSLSSLYLYFSCKKGVDWDWFSCVLILVWSYLKPVLSNHSLSAPKNKTAAKLIRED